jgi:hypothetical protein
MTRRYTGPSRSVAGRRLRRPSRVVAALLLVGAVLAVVASVPGSSPGTSSSGTVPSVAARPAAQPMAFGVLGSRCDPGRATALAKAGVRYAELGVDWSSFEPGKGSFDPGYEATVRREVEACNRAGLDVVLTLGLNTDPRWVAELPAGSYVDQSGDRGSPDVANVVFSAAVRGAVSGYLTELDRVVGLNSFAAIRVGTGTNGELGYPSGDASVDNPFWAFDDAAQQGVGLAGGMAVTPMPGWTPGSPTWRGAAVSPADVQAWFGWYSNSVADAVVWVVRQLRDLGYTYDIHLPLAGRGALPADLGRAVQARLNGAADRDGSLGSGLYYPGQLPRIAQQLAQSEKPGWGRVSADSGSVDDSTAVAARQLDPPQDTCRPGDAHRDLVHDPDVAGWSDFRWTVANARAAGLGVVGENPGPPAAAGTGGDSGTDGIAEQLVKAPRYALGCGMTLFQFAFEDDLFGQRGAGLRSYAGQIRTLLGHAGPAAASGTEQNR